MGESSHNLYRFIVLVNDSSCFSFSHIQMTSHLCCKDVVFDQMTVYANCSDHMCYFLCPLILLLLINSFISSLY